MKYHYLANKTADVIFWGQSIKFDFIHHQSASSIWDKIHPLYLLHRISDRFGGMRKLKYFFNTINHTRQYNK